MSADRHERQPLIPASSLVRPAREPAAAEGAESSAFVDSEAERLEAAPRRYERPMILKAVELGPAAKRRELLVASLALAAQSCAEIDITTENGACTCHAVCACDIDSSSSRNESMRERQGDGEVCTCNTVCICDSVCTCDSQGGGGGSSYWY